LLLDRRIVASEFLDPGTHPPQRGFRRKALTSSSGTHEQRLDLPKLLAQLRLAGHSDAPLHAPNRDHPITAQRQRQSSRPRYPEHSAQVNAGQGDPPVTLTYDRFSRWSSMRQTLRVMVETSSPRFLAAWRSYPPPRRQPGSADRSFPLVSRPDERGRNEGHHVSSTKPGFHCPRDPVRHDGQTCVVTQFCPK
jgi:hypothetical protein